MQYRTMPGSNDKLSVLGYGCMRLPTTVGGAASSLINKEKALDQIRYAIDNGVNYLDTAYPYHLGASESFLGEYVLKDGYREKVKIATKLPCMTIFKKEQIEEIFNKQLSKLQVEYIDYYMLHSMNGPSWERMLSLGIIDFMDNIRKEGRVKNMGFSFHGKKEDFIKICDGYNFDFAQVQYNIVDIHFQAGIEGIEYAHNKGMGIIVMEPLRGGSLVTKMPKSVEKIYKHAEIKRTPADWALRFVLNNPAVTLVLSGMNNMEHIKENIQVCSDSLPNGMSSAEVEILTSVKNEFDSLLQVNCTGCSYCLPCPAGIDIPAAFKNLNNFHMFSKANATAYHALYLGIQSKDGKAHWTSSCVNCGKCEAKCPQFIPVREKFKQVQKELETPLTKGMAAVGRLFIGNKN
ncbi:MAG: aldo/keto reductase [Spirochaetales bacterium]|nr:aldo/keto reductase [Spirochaetales bacterium]